MQPARVFAVERRAYVRRVYSVYSRARKKPL